MQQFINILLFLILNEDQTCFGRHTAHHQEPKTAQAASGFVYVEGCRTCSCWTLSGSVRYLITSIMEAFIQVTHLKHFHGSVTIRLLQNG